MTPGIGAQLYMCDLDQDSRVTYYILKDTQKKECVMQLVGLIDWWYVSYGGFCFKLNNLKK